MERRGWARWSAGGAADVGQCSSYEGAHNFHTLRARATSLHRFSQRSLLVEGESERRDGKKKKRKEKTKPAIAVERGKAGEVREDA